MREPMPQSYEEYDPREASAWPTPLIVASAETPGPVTPESVTVAGRPRRRRSFVGDISAGLFLGDFAADLGLPGAITQVAVSFIPLIGSTCAVRDLVADLRHHDRVGAALNALALTPVLGGFSKTFEVIRSTAHIGHAVHISHHQAERKNERDAAAQPPARHR